MISQFGARLAQIMTSRDRLSSFLNHVTQVGSQMTVRIVLFMKNPVFATMILSMRFCSPVKTQKGSGKLIFNVHSVIVELTVLSISMIFMLKKAIKKFLIENRSGTIDLSLTFYTLFCTKTKINHRVTLQLCIITTKKLKPHH